MIKQEAIDGAVRRVLHAKFSLGLFEDPYVETNDIEQAGLLKEHGKLAKEAALKSIVLLKNKQQVLPLSKQIKSLAVIGQDATEARLGGYSGPGNNPVSVLAGIKNKLPHSCKISYAVGCGRNTEDFLVIPSENLYFLENNKEVNGLRGDYYGNTTLEGRPLFSRNDKQIDFRWTMFSPDPDRLDYDNYSVRWTGRLKASQTGVFQIGVKGDDGYRLYLDNKLILIIGGNKRFSRLPKTSFLKREKITILKLNFMRAGAMLGLA
jgi:beta-glucosidase